jgi:hypothetical protein
VLLAGASEIQAERRTANLRMLPDMLPLEVIVSNPSAIDTLRKAA